MMQNLSIRCDLLASGSPEDQKDTSTAVQSAQVRAAREVLAEFVAHGLMYVQISFAI